VDLLLVVCATFHMMQLNTKLDTPQAVYHTSLPDTDGRVIISVATRSF
jgi:hypothetical protein